MKPCTSVHAHRASHRQRGTSVSTHSARRHHVQPRGTARHGFDMANAWSLVPTRARRMVILNLVEGEIAQACQGGNRQSRRLLAIHPHVPHSPAWWSTCRCYSISGLGDLQSRRLAARPVVASVCAPAAPDRALAELQGDSFTATFNRPRQAGTACGQASATPTPPTARSYRSPRPAANETLGRRYAATVGIVPAQQLSTPRSCRSPGSVSAVVPRVASATLPANRSPACGALHDASIGRLEEQYCRDLPLLDDRGPSALRHI